MATSLATLAAKVIIPQCERSVVLAALRDAAADFCQRTSAWRETVAVALAGGESQAQLALSGSPAASIGRLISLSIDDGTETPKTLSPKQYAMDGAGLLTWTDWTPNSGDVLTAQVAALPNMDCTEYPDALLRDWWPAIAAKAKADLLSQPGAPWTGKASEAALSKALDDYERLCARAARGNGRKSQSFFGMAPPNLAGTYGVGPLAWRHGRVGK